MLCKWDTSIWFCLYSEINLIHVHLDINLSIFYLLQYFLSLYSPPFLPLSLPHSVQIFFMLFTIFCICMDLKKKPSWKLIAFILPVCNCLQPHHNFARGDLVENLQQCATKLDVLLTTLGLKKQAHPPPLHKVDSEKVHTPCYYSLGWRYVQSSW